MVPATGRDLHVHGFLGRQVGGPGLHRKLRGDERLLVQARSDIVAFLGRVLIALLGRERKPLVGFREVLVDADAAGVKDAEIVLAVCNAPVGGFAEPLRRLAVVGLAVDPFGIKHRQIVYGLGVTLVGPLQIEQASLVEVLLHALAFLVKAAEAVERRRKALLGGAF